MTIRDFFLYHSPSKATYGGITPASLGEEPTPVPVFLTVASFNSFPLMSLLITVVTAIARTLKPELADNPVVPLCAALAIGAVILLVSTDKPRTKPKSTKQWIVAILIAFFNSLMLAASAMGLLQLNPGGAGAAKN